MAAALLLGGAIFTFLHHNASNSIHDFRTAMVQELWTIDDQARFRAPNVAELREWLKSHRSASDFALPHGLGELRVRDARIVNWCDRNVASLCLIGNGRHLHLFVVPTAALASAPPGETPQVDMCHGLETVVWSYGNNTYLLSGVNCLSLIRDNRRVERWFFAG